MFKNIRGQDKAVSIIRNAVLNRSLPHAYLFAGPSGVGKRFTAIELAKRLNCKTDIEYDCEGCASCRKIDRGNHPDIIFIAPDGESIKIDQMKEMQRYIGYRPYEGEKKVVIIDDAGQMGGEAANSFLKTLEEPPGDTLFILISVNPDMSLSTILSRCQIVKFYPLAIATTKDILINRLSIDEETAALLSEFSRGSVGKGLTLDVNECREKIDAIRDIFTGIQSKGTAYAFYKARELSALPKEELYEFLDYMALSVRDITVAHTCGIESVVNKEIVRDICLDSYNIHVSSMYDILNKVIYTKHIIKGNVSPELAVMDMMFKMAEIIAV